MAELKVDIFVGSVNLAIVVRCYDLSAGKAEVPNQEPFDLSMYFPSNVHIKFKKPDGTIVDKVATVTTIADLPGYVGDGTDGYAQYLTETGFLDQAGFWEWWVFVDGVEKLYSQRVKRKVLSNV